MHMRLRGVRVVSVLAAGGLIAAGTAYSAGALHSGTVTKVVVSYITTSSQEGAYLAGVLAAKTTKTHKIGIIISAADDNWYKMSGGFAAGFRSIDKSSKIFFATVSPTGYDDAAGGKRVA